MDILRKPSFEKWWPNLRRGGYEVTSPIDSNYNCFAWAVHQTDVWWDPSPSIYQNVFWPEAVPRNYSVEAYIQAYETFGFVTCDNEELEAGFEKIVIYAINGVTQHAARQLSSGRWTSKIAEHEDIEHSIDAFEGGKYFGSVAAILKRPIG